MNRFGRDVHEFDKLTADIRASVLVRASDAIAMSALEAADHSAAAARVRAVRHRFASVAPATRLRATAIAAAAAALGHVVLVTFVPAQVAPAMPKTLWLIVGAAAMVVAVFADRLLASWDTSATRRLWRATSYFVLRT